MPDKMTLLQMEEARNTKYCCENSSGNLLFVWPRAASKVDLSDALQRYPEGESLYDLICRFVRRLRCPYFVKKSGKLDEAGFYTYACIDKNTWSNIRHNRTLPSKETLLKLVFALQLDRSEADLLLQKASNGLSDADPRDRIVMALLDIACYDIGEVYEVMEEYGKHGAKPFPNIYGDPPV